MFALLVSLGPVAVVGPRCPDSLPKAPVTHPFPPLGASPDTRKIHTLLSWLPRGEAGEGPEGGGGGHSQSRFLQSWFFSFFSLVERPLAPGGCAVLGVVHGSDGGKEWETW